MSGRYAIDGDTLTGIAGAIRTKLGVQTQYTPAQMAGAIGTIHGNPVLQEKTATQNGVILPDSGYDGLSKVTVNVSGGGSGQDKVYLFNSGGVYTGQTRGLFDANGQSSIGYAPQIGQRNGEKAIVKTGSYAGYMCSSIAIPKEAVKLCIDIEIIDGSSSYSHLFAVTLLNYAEATTFGEYSNGNKLRQYFFAHSRKSVATINAQQGLTINATSNVALSRQVVEIDLSDITQDFYLATDSQNVQSYIYNVWYEL